MGGFGHSRGHGRDETTAVSHAADSAGTESDRVDAPVDSVRPFSLNSRLESIGCIDQLRRPQPARLVSIRVAHSRNDADTASSGELRREPTDHPGCPSHHHDVAFAHPSSVKEESSRESAHRERAALGEVEGIGERREDGGGYGDPLSECPDPHPWLSNEAENPRPSSVSPAKSHP